MRRTSLIFLFLISFAMSGLAQQKRAEVASYVQRFSAFVDSVAKVDTLSTQEKAEVDATYKAFISEYKTVKDSLSDEQVRECSKAKVLYQKTMAKVFINNTSDDVSSTATKIGKKASKIFKKTKSKVKGAIEALKE